MIKYNKYDLEYYEKILKDNKNDFIFFKTVLIIFISFAFITLYYLIYLILNDNKTTELTSIIFFNLIFYFICFMLLKKIKIKKIKLKEINKKYINSLKDVNYKKYISNQRKSKIKKLKC